MHEITEYVIPIRNLKQILNHVLVLKKVYKVIKFNQNAWLKSYIDTNTDLRKKWKKRLFYLFIYFINNVVFEKTMEMWESIEILNLSQQKEEGIN